MAVGNVSLLDWLWLTSSFGCTGDLAPSVPPASWIARLAITSLAFMLVCVPDPVWNTTSGNSASRSPSITSLQARMIRFTRSAGSSPSSPLASAAAFFSSPMARISGRVKRNLSVPMGKFWIERWVCAPHRRCAGTGSAPIASFSMRNPAGVVSSGGISHPSTRVGPVIPTKIGRR